MGIEAANPDLLPDWDQPVRYIERTHRWYAALGYGEPYRYAHYRDVPFTPLPAPLAKLRVALLTTAAPFRPEAGDQSVRAPYNASAKFFQVYTGDTKADHDLRISHVGVDRENLQDDANLWFPLAALRRARDRGRIGALSNRFIGVPTNRSQRHTIEVDIPQVFAHLREDQAQAAILVANCPVCHQTLSLTARHLEASGIPTVIIGCARDIVEYVGVPRLMFSDFPLGAACGRPFDLGSQEASLEIALRVLESAPGPRTTVQNPLRWSGPDDWRLRYMNPDRLSAAELTERRRAHEQSRSIGADLRRDAADLGSVPNP